MAGLQVTHTSTVTEDQIDHLGHMNVRYYAVNAMAGTDAVLGALPGWDGRRSAIVDTYTRHHHEQLLGTALEVRSALLDASPDGLRIHHELRAAETDDLAATFVHGIQALDDDGLPAKLDDAVIETVAAQAIALPDYAATRTVSLENDLSASTPTLELVRSRGLEMRQERRVTAAECFDDGRYRPDLAPMLTWGGEPLEGQQSDMMHETSDGKLMAWASMESRMVVNRWPSEGDRIQSFGAGIQLFDKVTHRIHWAYDLDRGDVLTSFEVVSMAFDIRARRPMSLPEGYRTREQANLQPDLAPGSNH